jgi:protein-S-isoprenylcysteine O-methyltransferase Ste14
MTLGEITGLIIFLMGATVGIVAFYNAWKESRTKIVRVENEKTRKNSMLLASVAVAVICLFFSLFLKSALVYGGDPEGVGFAIILSFCFDIVFIIVLFPIHKYWPRKKR